MSSGVSDLGRREDFDQSLIGGTWALAGEYCRSARHTGIWPDYRSPYCGFRLALREIGRVRDHDGKRNRE